jgi:hypothetical protein
MTEKEEPSMRKGIPDNKLKKFLRDNAFWLKRRNAPEEIPLGKKPAVYVGSVNETDYYRKK